MPISLKPQPAKDTRCDEHRHLLVPRDGVAAGRVPREMVQQATETAARHALERLRERDPGFTWKPPTKAELASRPKCPYCAAAAAVAYLNGETDE